MNYITQYTKSKRERTKTILIDVLGGECIECGSTNDIQFDHIIPETKLFNISQRLHYTISSLLDEVQKCQLLCADCHRKKTSLDLCFIEGGRHGVASTYTNFGCRCVECRRAWALYKFR